MNRTPLTESGTGGNPKDNRRWLWLFVAGCAAVILSVILLTFVHWQAQPAASEPSLRVTKVSPARGRGDYSGARHFSSNAGLAPSAGEIVAHKLALFVQGRRELVGRMAEHFKVSVPAEVEQFFKLAEAGNWEELQALFKTIMDRKSGGARSEAMLKLWPAVMETYGVIEQTHLWPAQNLLDYGQAVLGSLRPDMVYVGGTDAGRFIPTLLNDTGEGERHIVLTQNALADGSYLDYVQFLYGDRLQTLTSADSQRAFQEYLADAQRRLQHDQQFPDEPSQIRRGEDIRVTDNRVQVSGQVAVMGINELLLNALMQKNPDLSFAMQESFPLPSTYVNAAPLGPILELRAPDPQNALTPEKAAQSLDYWRSMAQQLGSDPASAETAEPRTAWSQMATAQANLLASQNLPGEAEQIYRIAADLSPTSLPPVSQLAEFLARAGRTAEANQLLDSFAARNASDLQKVEAEKKFLGTLGHN